MPDKSEPRSLRLQVTPTQDRPQAIAANWFHGAKVGDEFQLMIGWVDLADIHQASTTSGAAEMTVDVSGRIAVSLRGMQMLRSVVHQMIGAGDGEESTEGSAE